MIGCFFDFQDIGEPQRLMKKPLTNRRESEHAAAKGLNLKKKDLEIKNTYSEIFT